MVTFTISAPAPRSCCNSAGGSGLGTCPAGRSLTKAGTCSGGGGPQQPTCPAGTIYNPNTKVCDNTCLWNEKWDDDLAKCVPKCPDNTVYKNGSCEPCPAGQTWDQKTRSCFVAPEVVECRPGSTYNPVTGVCDWRPDPWNEPRWCPESMKWDEVQSKCVPDPTYCPESMKWDEVLSRCVRKCPDYTVYTESGTCEVCPTGQSWDPNSHSCFYDPTAGQSEPCKVNDGSAIATVDGGIVNGVCRPLCGSAILSRDDKEDMGMLGNWVAKLPVSKLQLGLGNSYFETLTNMFNFNPSPDGDLGQNKANIYDKCGLVISPAEADTRMKKGEIVFIVHTDSGKPTILNIEADYHPNVYPIKDFGCLSPKVPIPPCAPRPPGDPGEPFVPQCEPAAVDEILGLAGIPPGLGDPFCAFWAADPSQGVVGGVAGVIPGDQTITVPGGLNPGVGTPSGEPIVIPLG